MINVIHAVCSPLPIRFASHCTWWPLDSTLQWITGTILLLFEFRIQIITHARVKISYYRVIIWGPTPVMLWGGSAAAGQTLTWPPLPPAARYWLPWPPAGHPDQSSSTPPSLSGQGYWPLLWAHLAGGQAPPWGMPPWTTPMPQRPSSLASTVRHIHAFQLLHS
jgi:hypothetical protein